MSEFNIIGENFNPDHDVKLFTSSEEDELGISPELTPILETDKSMAHLLARLGKFASVGEAKRNGWDKPIPSGWNHFSVGKAAKRMDLFIWNPKSKFIEEE